MYFKELKPEGHSTSRPRAHSPLQVVSLVAQGLIRAVVKKARNCGCLGSPKQLCWATSAGTRSSFPGELLLSWGSCLLPELHCSHAWAQVRTPLMQTLCHASVSPAQPWICLITVDLPSDHTLGETSLLPPEVPCSPCSGGWDWARLVRRLPCYHAQLLLGSSQPSLCRGTLTLVLPHSRAVNPLPHFKYMLIWSQITAFVIYASSRGVKEQQE